MRDNHPGGDPDGRQPEQLLRHLADHLVDFYVLSIGSAADIMAEEFRKVYDNSGRQFAVHKMSTPEASFIPKVLESMKGSITASRLRGNLKP